MPWHGRYIGGGGKFLRLNLVAHRLYGMGIGADEHNSIILQRLRKRRPLRQKAVTWMHGLRSCFAAGVDNLVHDKIGLRRFSRADMHSFIGHLDMKRVFVSIRIYRHGGDAHFARGLDDAAGNFAAVGDENLTEHFGPGPKLGCALQTAACWMS